MMWRCMKCGREVNNIKVIKCPYCGYRIFEKVRPPVVKRVKAE